MDRMTLLVLGGARSGKSRYAQQWAEAAAGDNRIFIATAQAYDDEMADRIRRHQADRDRGWRTVEAPIDLPGAIIREAAPGRVLLVDCLTLWASNLMLANADIAHETTRLVSAVRDTTAPLALVANEVGLGIVPDNALARRFRDAAGTINQAVAAAADRAVFMAAGLPIQLK